MANQQQAPVLQDEFWEIWGGANERYQQWKTGRKYTWMDGEEPETKRVATTNDKGIVGGSTHTAEQIQQPRFKLHSVTRTHRAAGTFFLNDNGDVNRWANLPWEFPRLWLPTQETRRMAQRFTHYRVKNVRLKLCNIGQMYSSINNTQVWSGVSQDCKMLVWEDKAHMLGHNLFPGVNGTDWATFLSGARYGGFNRTSKTAVALPLTLPFDTSYNNNVCNNSLSDSSYGTTRVPANADAAYETSYSPTEASWRDSSEWLINISQQNCSEEYLENTADNPLVNLTNPLTYELLPFRADNHSCRLINPEVHSWPGNNTSGSGGSAGTSYIGLNHCPIRFPWCLRAKNVGNNIDGDQLASQATLMHFTAPIQTVDHSMYVIPSLPHVVEHNPQHQIWLGIVNKTGPDASSIMVQQYQIDFVLEYDIEWQGYMMTPDATLFSIIDQNTNALRACNLPCRTVTAELYFARWVAYPFYNCGPGDASGSFDTQISVSVGTATSGSWNQVCLGSMKNARNNNQKFLVLDKESA